MKELFTLPYQVVWRYKYYDGVGVEKANDMVAWLKENTTGKYGFMTCREPKMFFGTGDLDDPNNDNRKVEHIKDNVLFFYFENASDAIQFQLIYK